MNLFGQKMSNPLIWTISMAWSEFKSKYNIEFCVGKYCVTACSLLFEHLEPTVFIHDGG